MWQPPIYYVTLADAGGERVQAGLDLGHHAGCDPAVRYHLARVPGGELRDKRVRVLWVPQHTADIGEHYQLVRLERPGNAPREVVGIDVQSLTAGARRDRRNDGDEPL